MSRYTYTYEALRALDNFDQRLAPLHSSMGNAEAEALIEARNALMHAVFYAYAYETREFNRIETIMQVKPMRFIRRMVEGE